MKPAKISAIGFGLCLALLLSSAAALADGMPVKKKEPEPVFTPLDKALDEIQNKEPPVEMTRQEEQAEPPAAVEPAPVAAAPPEEPKVESPPPVPESRVVEVQPNGSFFGLSVGMYDPFSHGRQAAALTMEWQPGVRVAGVLQPLFGALVTTNGALMGYGGLGLPIKLSERIQLMPSAAVGAYKHGDGVDLGQTIAYRLGSELAYVFDDKSRIGLNAHIITNGKNRHTEVIGLAYTAPFDLFAGRNQRAIDEMKAAEAPKTPDAIMSQDGQKP